MTLCNAWLAWITSCHGVAPTNVHTNTCWSCLWSAPVHCYIISIFVFSCLHNHWLHRTICYLSLLSGLTEYSTGSATAVIYSTSHPLLHLGYPILELVQSLMRSHGPKMAVKHILRYKLHTPFLEVIFEGSLMELVEDIWGYARENVGVGEISPEGWKNGTEAIHNELRGVLAGSLGVEYVCCLCLIAQWKLGVCTMLVSRHVALGAPVLSTAGNEALLWVVTDKYSKNLEDTLNPPICTHHFHPISTSCHQRLHHFLHAVVEQAIAGDWVVLEGLHFQYW